MKAYSTLSRGQQRCVIKLFEINSKLNTSKGVTRKEVIEAFNQLKATGAKTGFPNWLLTQEFKNSQGKFVIPAPTKEEMAETINPTKKRPKAAKKALAPGQLSKRDKFKAGLMEEADMEYYAILDSYGVEF